jgi:DNA-3-methyladenine glycosylase II
MKDVTAFPRLDQPGLEAAVRVLARRDRDLRDLVARHGPPPLWSRPAGFATLVRIILEQQVSLASAQAVFQRVRAAAGGVSVPRVHAFGYQGLRRAGLTRQKARYVATLAEQIAGGAIRLTSLSGASDAVARAELVRLHGVGEWTADIYLLMALRRPDVWPTGDLALLTALMRAKRLPTRPSTAEAAAIAAAWAPWRSVAARILWHAYLSARAT